MRVSPEDSQPIYSNISRKVCFKSSHANTGPSVTSHESGRRNINIKTSCQESAEVFLSVLVRAEDWELVITITLDQPTSDHPQLQHYTQSSCLPAASQHIYVTLSGEPGLWLPSIGLCSLTISVRWSFPEHYSWLMILYQLLLFSSWFAESWYIPRNKVKVQLIEQSRWELRL